ncbi:TRAP transporter large permease [Ihubacter massiliensis]|uniref:TRAP transporter large permease n=1 Tax=Hominibacterium faecale TaxID=2839743 RepID=A0A9J6QMZ2_9FIRM|nr:MULTISPECIES: TRAP transporter large permease [Eubacteriales Family XIII. Incertae Sedis]MCO7122993.1 TRAP transporter large permease [Ihubacter massiliensis]MCU7377253.1 TRAP transporter large permease [Hominibacterium faecale]
MIYLGIFLLVFLGLALIRVPIPFAMGIGSVVTMLYAGVNLDSVPMAVSNSLNVFTWLAIPAFIFAGDLMAATGISSAIMNFAKSFIGRLRGAAGAVTVVTCMLFGAITGSSLATITGIGGMMLPELDKEGYDHKYGTALISACGFLGILIPPSIPGILYAMMSGQNLMKVWLCTVGPGIMLGLAYILINYFKYGRKQEKVKEPFRVGSYFAGIGKATWSSLLALLMPVIIFYGIYGGIFTATEAGAVAVAYGLIVGWIILPIFKKKWPEKKFRTLVLEAGVTSATIAMLNVFAAVAGKMITFTRIPAMLTDAMLSLTDSKIIFLLILNILLIIVGMFMETNSSILLLGPILIPVATSFGVDPIHFAGIMLLNLEIGMITPPFAANLFVGCRVGKVSMDQVLPFMVPFFIACVIVLLITTYVPQVALFLPNLI